MNIEKRNFLTMVHKYTKKYTKLFGGNYHINLGQVMKLMYEVKRNELDYSEFCDFFKDEITLKREQNRTIEEIQENIKRLRAEANRNIILLGGLDIEDL